MKKLTVFGLVAVFIGLGGYWLSQNESSQKTFAALKHQHETAKAEAEKSKEEFKSLDKLREEQNRQEPLIDPAICKDNPEGYIYFQLGEEVFRYTKDSPVQIDVIFSNSERRLKRKIKDTNIPEGCEGNPYTGVIPKYEYKEGGDPVGNIKFNSFGFMIIPPDRYSVVSMGQASREEMAIHFKNNGRSCEFISEGLERCMTPATDRPREEWSVSYVSDVSFYTAGFNRPYVLDCRKFAAAGLLCETFYRIYPSLDINYSYYPYENNFDDKNIILLDKYVRNVFESMRVK